MQYFDGTEINGVPVGHKIGLIARIDLKDYLVLHRSGEEGLWEIKIGPLEQLRNSAKVIRESTLSKSHIIMTSLGALDIPFPKNIDEIKLDKTDRPIFDEKNKPTLI